MSYASQHNARKRLFYQALWQCRTFDNNCGLFNIYSCRRQQCYRPLFTHRWRTWIRHQSIISTAISHLTFSEFFVRFLVGVLYVDDDEMMIGGIVSSASWRLCRFSVARNTKDLRIVGISPQDMFPYTALPHSSSATRWAFSAHLSPHENAIRFSIATYYLVIRRSTLFVVRRTEVNCWRGTCSIAYGLHICT